MPSYTDRSGSVDASSAYRDVRKVAPKPLRSNFPWWLLAPNLTSPTPETPTVARAQMRERRKRAQRAVASMDKVRKSNRLRLSLFCHKPARVA